MAVPVAEVILWGRTIGAVSWNENRTVAEFEFTREFQQSGLELAPLTMPLGPRIYSFPELAGQSFHGLPGMLADSLPDRFGNLLIDQWLVRQGRDPGSFSPVERLCYIGARGMGAMEFQPVLSPRMDRSQRVDIDHLVELASQALSEKEQLTTRISGDSGADHEAMRDILRVGTSAGGTRAKAIIALNESTNEVRSGQIEAPEGFTYWILKFDGVSGNRDRELEDPQGYGKVEYAYSLMAKEAGIEMTTCRLLRENGRSHFMTRRFDRTPDGKKIFMQSLCALNHMDFNQAGAYGYEQAIEVAGRLEIPRTEIEQLFRRMAFNIMARNQDDHTKNITFLMNRNGRWALAPAYDLTYSYNPKGKWTNQHQMTLNGKRDGFDIQDFEDAARRFRLLRGNRFHDLMQMVDHALAHWRHCASKAGVPEDWTLEIESAHRRLSTL